MKFQQTFPIPADWYSDTDELLVDSLYRWADRHVIGRRTELGEDLEKLLRPAMKTLFDEVGLRDLVISGEPNKPFSAWMTLALSLEQIGRADTGIGFLLANSYSFEAALFPKGKTFYTVRSQGGHDATFGALVLPSYGPASSAFHGLSAPATAIQRENTLVLEGNAMRPQCSGVDAQFFGVLCELEGTPALVAVPSTTKGFERGESIVKTGLAASQNCDIALNSVELSQDHLIFVGDAHYRSLLSHYYLACASVSSGAMLAAWSILHDWGESRVIKGKGQVFRNNPLVAHLMGQIGGKIGSSRLLLFSLARLLSVSNEPVSASHFATATSVVMTVTKAAMDCLDGAMELMASAGYSREWNLERPWRDMKTIQSYLGPAPSSSVDMARHYFGCESL